MMASPKSTGFPTRCVGLVGVGSDVSSSFAETVSAFATSWVHLLTNVAFPWVCPNAAQLSLSRLAYVGGGGGGGGTLLFSMP